MNQTTNVFWSTLETSMSLIAINLASLWGLLSKTSPMKLLRNIRVIFSRLSSQSRSSHGRQWPTRSFQRKRSHSTSLEPCISPESVSVRTEVNSSNSMRDLEAQTDRTYFDFPEPSLPPFRKGSKHRQATMAHTGTPILAAQSISRENGLIVM